MREALYGALKPVRDRQRRLVNESREGLCVAGVGDLWEDKCLYARALGGVSGGVPRILLSHNPDVVEEGEFIRSGYRVDLMLSGHTHGGQVRLPVIGSIFVPSTCGRRYDTGTFAAGRTVLHVSRGLSGKEPLRFRCDPQVTRLTLRRPQ